MIIYRAIDVARHIINYKDISNLKLQKILYFIQAYYLTEYNVPIFEEDIYSSSFGPVVWEVYNEFKMFGAMDIPKITTYLEYENNNIWSVKKFVYKDKEIRDKDKKNIEKVVDIFYNYYNHELNELVFNQAPYYLNTGKIIPINDIKKYFSEKY